MDRISQLPIEILHQILSLLPTKTAARTAVLSKPWLKACYTNSSLCFDESDFGKEGRNNGKFLDFHGKFSRLVDNTLERYRRDICYTEFYLSRHNLDICLRTIEIGTCQNLRRVEFVNAEIDDTVLFKLIPKLHLIKELILHYCKCLKKIKIASSTLEVCSIECCKYLVQATFDVPNLLSLVVKPMQNFDKRTRLPSLSFASASSQCRISIKYGDLPSDVEHIIDLRRYLVELNDKVVDLTLGSVYKGLKAARGIDHLPAPEVENLILLTNCDWSDTTYSSYLNDIFWICLPKNLTVHCGKKFRKFLRQKLLKKCRWRPFKYAWKEYFINAQIDCKKWTEDDWMTLDWKMLAANPRMIDEIRRIRFKQTQGKEIKKESYILRCIPR